MEKVIVFDMDGTIADFYGVDGWLEYLGKYDTTPYKKAKPIYDTKELNSILKKLKKQGWTIAVTTWLSKTGTREYNKRTRVVKKQWLDRYDFPYDELHMVRYGTTKANCTRKIGGYQILVDDNEQIRKGWRLGDTIDANKNIIPELKKLLGGKG